MERKEVMQIRIYIAAPFDCKPQAKEARKQLQDAGFEVTSRWIDLPDGTTDKPESYFVENAHQDVEDVLSSDIVVLLNIHKSEGKAVETGLAIASNIPIILVGERSNIFHYLNIARMSDVPAAIALIKQWVVDYEKQLENNKAAEDQYLETLEEKLFEAEETKR